MLLVGVKLWELTFDGKEEGGSLGLDPRNPSKVIITSMPPSQRERFDSWMRGIPTVDGDISTSKIIGEKYGLSLPEARKYTPEDGSYFLLALMVNTARNSYSYLEPIER